MTNLRAAFSAFVAALLVFGWGAAAIAAMNGTASAWAVRTDAPPIRLLALFTLLGAIVLAFVPERPSPSEEATK